MIEKYIDKNWNWNYVFTNSFEKEFKKQLIQKT